MYKKTEKFAEALNSPVVISTIHEGLGNQMFQYAHALSVAEKFNLELRLNLRWFSYSREVERPFWLSAFEGFRYKQATESELAFVYSLKGSLLNRCNQFLMRKQRKPIYKICLALHYLGERYFRGFSSSVRDCFKFPPLQTEAGRRTAELIRGGRASVALHVRRGDYLVRPDKNIVTAAYYKKAMELVEARVAKPCYFVFSDDLPYCKNLFQGNNVSFVEGCASEIEEMHLMTLCNHSIIANSTFSWWGAWLGDDKELVVSPSRWLNNERRNEKFRRDGMFPDAWQRLEF